MLKTISNLPNKLNIFTPKNYAVYVLDDYSVHLMPEFKEAFLKRGYVPIIIGGGVTGGIQINDTDIHRPLKEKYRALEQQLMIDQLKADPKRIPQPSRDDMRRMLKKSFESLEIDVASRFKALWVTNALDRGEDYLVSERIIALVGNKMKTFRNDLMKKKNPKSLKDSMKLITPPKGIRRKNLNDDMMVPPEEGDELFDSEGDKLISWEQNQEEESDEEENSETEGQDSTVPIINVNTQEGQSSSSSVSILPADSCPEDSELKKDASFLDDLGKWLLTVETLIHFLLFMNNFKKSYVADRRSVKKRILISKEQAEIYASSETAEEQTADDLEEGDISNIFEKPFE